jgi:hypothetical protein
VWSAGRLDLKGRPLQAQKVAAMCILGHAGAPRPGMQEAPAEALLKPVTLLLLTPLKNNQPSIVEVLIEFLLRNMRR